MVITDFFGYNTFEVANGLLRLNSAYLLLFVLVSYNGDNFTEFQ